MHHKRHIQVINFNLLCLLFKSRLPKRYFYKLF